ncbi:MAG: YdiU family protein [Acidobacteria bacterium]|nr:YdiU family protein [Acidobacteriota bacterium]
MSLIEDRDLKPLRIPFANSYARLPENFYARVAPTPVTTPRLVKLNLQLADLLGLDAEALASPEGVAVLAGSRVAEGSEPLAMAYAGHQFGYFVRQLGDGRTNLLGEVVGRDGIRYDIQLKGSGRTPFSRNGDGRAAIGPVLREYIVSEAMATLGVPTTRSLAAVTTGQAVFRVTVLPGAVLTRVAASHLRVGTFQYFFAQGDVAALRRLADYAIGRHYSEEAAAPDATTATRRYRAFLDGVVTRQAKLVAQWMLLGFIHGVMNTDNTSISGETIDYGPCAFMEAYHPRTVFSSIDHQGRYSYSNQPNAMHWNLARLAETILPLLVEEEGGDEAGLASAYESLEQFGKHYETALNTGMRRKLGLTREQEGDTNLIDDLLNRMMEQHADYTLTFRRLCDAAAGTEGNAAVRSMFTDPAAFDEWEPRWRHRLAQEPLSPEERAAQMRHTNPIYIPRNHMVEAALEAATEKQDFQPFEDLLHVLAQPFDERPGLERYATPARPEEYVTKTFCGT